MLAAGPVVQELSQTFDAYWNNPRAYPVQSLISRHQLLEMQASVRKAAQGMGTAATHLPRFAHPQPHKPSEKRHPSSKPASGTRPMDLKAAPDLGPCRRAGGPCPRKLPPKVASNHARTTRSYLLERTPELGPTDPQRDTVVDGLLQLMGQAKRRICSSSRPTSLPART